MSLKNKAGRAKHFSVDRARLCTIDCIFCTHLSNRYDLLFLTGNFLFGTSNNDHWKYRSKVEQRPEAVLTCINSSDSTLHTSVEYKSKPFRTPSRAPPNHLHTPKPLLSSMFRPYLRPNVPLLQTNISKSNQLGQRCVSRQQPLI